MSKVLLFFLVLVTSSVIGRPGDITNSQKIDQNLLKVLETNYTTNIFISFTEGTKATLSSISNTKFQSREDRLTALYFALFDNAKKSQSNVISFLSDFRGFIFESYWATNQLFLENADLTIVNALSTFPEVSQLFEELIVTLDDPTEESPIITYRKHSLAEWGIKKIQAQNAHEFLVAHLTNSKATSTTNIRVATIDTGVLYTHEALKDNYAGGNYSWFDPYQKTPFPNDQSGHGTHTTGIICGKGGIGVYPDAKWLACKGCSTNSCTLSALIACGQFVLCPTTADGKERDCTKAPHVVSNSWGTRRSNYYDDVIAAWHVAKIIPVFSIGNSGPECNTADSPGDGNVISVGSTTIDDEISSFSSKGPSVNGKLKPDVSSPGSNIISAYHTSDNEYRSLSGTSMACPHTAGLVAMLLAYNPDLSYKQVSEYIFNGAETKQLKSNETVCAQIADDVFPNPIYGFGRINALNSLSNLAFNYAKKC